MSTTPTTPALTVSSVAKMLEISYDAVRQQLKRRRAFDGAVFEGFWKVPPTQDELRAVLEGATPIYSHGPINCDNLSYASHAECALFSGVPWSYYRTYLSEGLHPNQFIWPEANFDPTAPVTVGERSYPSLFQYAQSVKIPAFMLFWLASKGLLTEASLVERRQVNQMFDLLESDENYRFPLQPLKPNSKGKFAFGQLRYKSLEELCEACNVSILALVKLCTSDGHTIESAIGFMQTTKIQLEQSERALTDLMSGLRSGHTDHENPTELTYDDPDEFDVPPSGPEPFDFDGDD